MMAVCCVPFSVTAAVGCPIGSYPRSSSTKWPASPSPCGNAVEEVPERRRSVQAAADADELPLDPHVVVELRRIGRVGGLQADLVLLLEEPLERDGVLLD